MGNQCRMLEQQLHDVKRAAADFRKAHAEHLPARVLDAPSRVEVRPLHAMAFASTAEGHHAKERQGKTMPGKTSEPAETAIDLHESGRWGNALRDTRSPEQPTTKEYDALGDSPGSGADDGVRSLASSVARRRSLPSYQGRNETENKLGQLVGNGWPQELNSRRDSKEHFGQLKELLADRSRALKQRSEALFEQTRRLQRSTSPSNTGSSADE